MNVLYLSEADVRGLLTMDLALEAVEAAFRKISLDEAVNVPRQRCQTDHVMLPVPPAAAKTLGAIGFKAYTTGKFPTTFHVHLFDPKTGGPTAIVEADYLGRVRTGAANRNGRISSRIAIRASATQKINSISISTSGACSASGQCISIVVAPPVSSTTNRSGPISFL